MLLVKLYPWQKQQHGQQGEQVPQGLAGGPANTASAQDALVMELLRRRVVSLNTTPPPKPRPDDDIPEWGKAYLADWVEPDGGAYEPMPDYWDPEGRGGGWMDSVAEAYGTKIIEKLLGAGIKFVTKKGVTIALSGAFGASIGGPAGAAAGTLAGALFGEMFDPPEAWGNFNSWLNSISAEELVNFVQKSDLCDGCRQCIQAGGPGHCPKGIF